MIARAAIGVVAIVAGLAGVAPLAVGASGPVGFPARLSDERTVTRWAYANLAVLARTAPAATAPGVARLHFRTEDGLPEVYVALRSTVDAAGAEWIEVRLPMRPNGRTGWVPREALGDLHRVDTLLRVNRTTLRATLYRAGRVVWSSGIGVGKRSTPTPAGSFYIRERLSASGGLYGPLAFGTSAYSRLTDWPHGGVVGIHGTNQPSLIPGRPSHGCVRVPNQAILRLGRLMGIGTPVQIV